jgi:DNA invertase Pin-like site-specific DNA recombinase
MTKRRAFSYLRISTPAQALGHGVQRQLEASRKYAEEHDLELAGGDELQDVGVSAYRGINVAEGALGRFLDAVKTGKVDRGSTLIVESLDRISRQQVMKSMGLLIEIVNSGINVATLADGRTYTSGAGFEEMIYSIVSLSRAHDESRTKSLRVASAWSNKRKNIATKKLTARCPAWLSLSDDKKTFRVIPARAEVVRGVFQDSADGIGTYTITQRLNRDRVPAFMKGGSWHESYLNKILTNRAAIGEFQPHRVVDGKRVPDGEPIKEYFPRVVDDEVFYRAQVGRGQRSTNGGVRRSSGVPNLFSGLLKCAYCNGRMLFERKNHAYLVCYSAKRGLGCVWKRWRYDEFETSFLTFVKEVDLASMINSDDDSKKRATLEALVTSLKGELGSIEDQMNRTYELLQVAGAATNFVARKLQELEERKVTVEKDLREKEAELARKHVDQDVREVRGLIDKVKGTSDEDDTYRLRSMIATRLRSIVRVIYVAPEGRGPLALLSIEPVELGAGPVVDDIRRAMVTQRYFMVGLHDGSVRVIFPDRDAGLRLTHLDPLPASDEPKGESKKGEGSFDDERSAS